MKHVSLGGLEVSRPGDDARRPPFGWRRVTRSGATPAVLVDEREEKPPAVRQN
jgi:hypothetical protein